MKLKCPCCDYKFEVPKSIDGVIGAAKMISGLEPPHHDSKAYQVYLSVDLRDLLRSKIKALEADEQRGAK